MKDEPKNRESRFRRQQRSLARLIERLKATPVPYRKQKEAQYRKIIRRSLETAAGSDGTPVGLADCEKWLEQTGLKKDHVRAITAILHDAEIANAFLHGNPPLSLTAALKKIREKAHSADQRPPLDAPPPDLNALLTTLFSELLRQRGDAKPFPLKCGIYELAFTARAGGDIFVTPPRVFESEFPKRVELPPDKVIGLQVAPDIAELLGKAGRFSGLTRAEVVAELVSRQDPGGLVEALKAPEI